MKVGAPKIKQATLYEHQTCWKLLPGFAKWVLKQSSGYGSLNMMLKWAMNLCCKIACVPQNELLIRIYFKFFG
jgi:hypothetical protein